VTGRPKADRELTAAVETSVDSVVHAAAERAAQRAAEAWREQLPGRALLTAHARLDAASPGLLEATASEVRAWQGFVF
jgi:hypothetical protein